MKLKPLGIISESELQKLEQVCATPPHSEGAEEQFSGEKLLERLRLFWNRRQLLLRCGFAGLLAGTLTAFLIPKRYDSTAQLMPPDSESSSSLALLAGMSGGNGGGLGILAGDLLGMKSTGALFVGVLRSRTVEDRIVDRFDLKKVYGKSFQSRAREKLTERTAISEDRKSGIIAITVTDRDPKQAAAMAAAYVEELNTTIAEQSTSSARRERIFLEERLATVKQDLEAAEEDFSQFASKKGAIDIPAQGKAMVEGAAALEGQLIAAQSELEGLKQIYSDQNVRVRSTQARINGLREQLRQLSGKADSASGDGDDSAGNQPYPTLRQLPVLGVPFADKLRRMKVQEVLFETLTKQCELAKVQEAKEIPAVKVLDAPVVPEHKSYPPRLLIIFLGVSGGLLAGIVWLLGEARWRETDSEDPGKLLAIEVFEAAAARIAALSRNGRKARAPTSEPTVVTEKALSQKSASAGN